MAERLCCSIVMPKTRMIAMISLMMFFLFFIAYPFSPECLNSSVNRNLLMGCQDDRKSEWQSVKKQFAGVTQKEGVNREFFDEVFIGVSRAA